MAQAGSAVRGRRAVAAMVRWEVPPSRRLAFVVVLCVVAGSVLATVFVDFRLGGDVLAGALALAATLRATLPEEYCLGLLVRSRRFDVALDAGLALGVLVLAQIVPGQS